MNTTKTLNKDAVNRFICVYTLHENIERAKMPRRRGSNRASSSKRAMGGSIQSSSSAEGKMFLEAYLFD